MPTRQAYEIQYNRKKL